MNRTSHARQLTARSIYSFQRAFLTIPLAVVALAGLVLGGSGYLRTGTFSRLSKLTVARAGHTATLLPDGRVLIIGGDSDGTAEIYDPRAEIASPAGRMNSARTGHTASLLSDGRVLVAGGAVDGAALASTEIYDPSTEIFEPGPEMDSPRAGHTATTLSDGSILITGGGSDTELILNEGVFTQLRSKLAISRVNASALAMNDGRVLIVGGDDVASVEIFDPLTQMFEPVGEMRVMRARPLLRALRDGKVQIVGGNNDGSMEIYDPASNAIGAYAHVVPETDPCTNLATYVLSSATRAALIFRDSPSVDLDLNGHTITELGLAAIVIGGTDSRGEPVDTITRFDSSAATVTTDKLDYAPGETAHVSGTGFAPGELVRVMIHEDPHTPFERGFDATTDAAGNFAGTYAVRDHDLRMTFVVGVRGLTSGRTAQTTFTDASPGTLGNFATLGLSGATVSVAPSNLATNISFSNLTRGTGLTAASLTNAFNSSGWTTSATPDANDYYEFTITPNAGFAFSTSELRIGLQRSSTGPPNLVLRSSLDSYASNIGPVIAPPTGSIATTTIDLSPVAGLQNAMAPVTLRFYGYGASSGAGTLRIERVTSVPMVGLEVDGNVAQSCVSPAITAHPSDLNVLYGMFATFNAAADGTGLNVVWEVSADDGATWTNTGVTTATLSFPVAGVALDGNLYRAVFSNSCGTSTSNSARLSVGRKPLTPIVTADDKTYDGAASATVSSCTLDAVEPGDIVNCSVAGPITFSDPNAGAGKMVTAENIGLAGVASDNYALTSTTATTTADIDPAPTETDLDCLPGTFVYAASSITPCSATVTGANLATSTDVVYMNNLNAGIATANASYPGDPNHTGSTADESEFSITKMPAAWTTNDANRFFGSTEPSPVTTGFGSGFFAADGVSATYAREGGSGAGLYHITATLSSTALGNYEITNTGATFTIIPDPTSITGDANVDGVNGDCTNNTYTSTLKDTITNDGIVGVAMRMTIGSQQATALTDSNGVATFTLTLAQSPGVVQQSFQLDQSWTDPNRVSPLATSPRNFTVSGDPDVEPGNNADSMYTGSLFFWTTSATSNTATLTLSATIKDSSGSCSNGDITRARVSFLVSSNGGSTFIAVPNAQNLPVGLVDPNEPSVGTASATSQYNIGTAQSATLIVRVVVGGFYNFSSSEYDTPITIGKSGSANSLMGGGKLKNDGSPFFASGYIGMNSISSTFGTHVQYNKKGTNPQGDVTLYVRSCNFPNGSHDVACVSADPSTHHVYFIKSNSISELALIGGSASFSSKANVSEVMNDDERVTLDGGNTMQLLFTPFGLTLPSNNAGNPIGAVCTSAGGCASIIVYRSSGIGGGVWYSSSWGQPAGKPLQTWLKSVSNGTVAVQ